MIDAGQSELQEDPLEDYDPGSGYRRDIVFLLALIPVITLYCLSSAHSWALSACLHLSYSTVVLSEVFCQAKYSLRRRWVREQLLALFAVHLAFLLLIWFGQLFEPLIAAAMPHFMTVRTTWGSLFDWLIMVVIVVLGIEETFVFRRVLESNKPLRAPAPLPKANLKPMPDAKLTFIQELDELDTSTFTGKLLMVLKLILRP